MASFIPASLNQDRNAQKPKTVSATSANTGLLKYIFSFAGPKILRVSRGTRIKESFKLSTG
jgi:hypothetical protein